MWKARNGVLWESKHYFVWLYIILIFYSLSIVLSITLKKLYIGAYVRMPRHVPMHMCVHACTKRSEVNLRCCSLGNVLCFVWLFGVFLWQGLSLVWGLLSRLPGQWASGTSLTLNSQLGLPAVRIQEDPWSSPGFVANVVLRKVGPQACVAWLAFDCLGRLQLCFVFKFRWLQG